MKNSKSVSALESILNEVENEMTNTLQAPPQEIEVEVEITNDEAIEVPTMRQIDAADQDNGIQAKYLRNELSTMQMCFAVCEGFKLDVYQGHIMAECTADEKIKRQNALKTCIAIYHSKGENEGKTTGSIDKNIRKFCGYVETQSEGSEPRAPKATAKPTPPALDHVAFSAVASDPIKAAEFLTDYTARVNEFNAQMAEIEAENAAKIAAFEAAKEAKKLAFEEQNAAKLIAKRDAAMVAFNKAWIAFEVASINLLNA